MGRRLSAGGACRAAAVAAALFVCAAPEAAAQGEWERYRPGKIADVWADRQEELETFLQPGSPDYALSGRDFPIRARVTYTGEWRRLTPEAAQVLALWLRAFGGDVEDATLFEAELLVREDGRDFWLPVQRPVVPHFAEELEPGDPVTLYVIYIGAVRRDDEVIGVFLVNEFDAKQGAEP